jgi:sortase A
MKSVHQWCLAAVACTAAFFIANALWIPVKAQAGQVLLERAWQRSLAGDPDARPWPWADTRPVAILEAPRLGIRQFVLEGASGRNLAFGPAAISPVTASDVVLSGHRDTHFDFLQELRENDLLRLVLPGRTTEFRVRFREVVDSGDLQLVLDPTMTLLTLVTCYPFEALTAGGPERYVVTAHRL